jgi:hypothetical protein
MAVILKNPDDVPREVTSGYQQQNKVLYASMMGYINVNLKDNTISAGSIFEINGVLFRCLQDEYINGLTGISLSTFFYIYAVPTDESNVEFTAKTIKPEWNNLKGGYYETNTSNRAIIKAIKYDGNNIGAIKMNSILTDVNSVMPANTGGTSIFNKAIKTHEGIHGLPGWYRFEIKSGLGGNNGSNGLTSNSNNPVAPAGGVPSKYVEFSGVFYHNGGIILAHVGGNGYAGNSGNRYFTNSDNTFTAFSGAGGGGEGEETYIISGSQKYTTGNVPYGDGGEGYSSTTIFDYLKNQNNGNGGNYYTVNSSGNAPTILINFEGGKVGKSGILRPHGEAAAGYCKIWRI